MSGTGTAVSTSMENPTPLHVVSSTSEPLLYVESRTAVRVSGGDALTWLNGLVTCDVLSLDKKSGKSIANPLNDGPAGAALYGCALNVKGKILGDVIITWEPDTRGLHVFAPTNAVSGLLDLWEKYIVMEDVELTRSELQVVHWIGPNTPMGRSNLPLELLGSPAWVRVVDAAELALLREGPTAPRLVEEAEMAAWRIRLGRPTFGLDFDSTNYVQEAGLEQRAVSFSKGCYLGQEVVCMLQMRGHAQKRLVLLDVPAGSVAAGESLMVAGQVVGRITSVEGDRALGFLKLTHTIAGTKAATAETVATVIRPLD